MKKITFILFALIAGTTFAQDRVATADVNAVIASPLKITSDQNLEFGLIASDALVANTIEVTNDGSRTQIDGVTLAGGAIPQQAIFSISAGGNAYSVVSILKTDLMLDGGTETMILTLTNKLDEVTHKLSVGGKIDVKIGQTPGTYVGKAKVTVAYN